VIDSARIHIRAGDGGHGLISFRREKYEPRGGPDGGDGGRGGDVVLAASGQVNGLGQFRYKKEYKADKGSNGGASKKHGRNGIDLVLRVPPGTIAKDGTTGEVIGEVMEEEATLRIARGGKGGRGNVHFDAGNQAPYISETGQRGEEVWIDLG
jgi:GTP-binding protein